MIIVFIKMVNYKKQFGNNLTVKMFADSYKIYELKYFIEFPENLQ